MVGQQTARTVDGAGETRCYRLVDWNCPGVVLVLRNGLILLLSTLPLTLLMLTIALHHLFLLLSDNMLLSHVLLFDFSLSVALALALTLTIEARRGLWWLIVHVDRR